MIENRKFEWDEKKRRANVQKHGIDFGDAKEIFDDPAAHTFSSPRSAGEQRFVTIGSVKGLLVAVISTLRGSAVRIISARIARRGERHLYGSESSKEGR